MIYNEKVIALDIDDTLVNDDIYEYYMNKFSVMDIKIGDNLEGSNIPKLVLKKIISGYHNDYMMSSLTPNVGSVEFVQKCMSIGYTVICVTNRGHDIAHGTRKMIKKHFGIDEIYFVKSKKDFFNEYGWPKLYVDDSYKNISDVFWYKHIHDIPTEVVYFKDSEKRLLNTEFLNINLKDGSKVSDHVKVVNSFNKLSIK